MAKLETVETGLGNTKPSQTKRIIPTKNWCFTWNNYPENGMETLETLFAKDKYVIGKEVGEKNGTRHLQGYVEFQIKTRPLEKIKIKEISWRKAKGTRDENLIYCSKEGDFKTNFKMPKPLKKLACEDNMYEWQKEIIAIIEKEPDDRTIHWYWEPTGCAGKTTFSKYLTRKYGAIPLEGKKNDILYCSAMFESDIYIYDLERSMENFVSYSSIEKIKNGYYMCAKYESKPIDRNPPHVIIFANFEPDEYKLSKDRWNIRRI